MNTLIYRINRIKLEFSLIRIGYCIGYRKGITKKKQIKRTNKINRAIENYIVESTIANNGINSSRDVCNEIHRVFKKRILSASIRRLRQKHVDNFLLHSLWP
jgi:hypothetical protein